MIFLDCLPGVTMSLLLKSAILARADGVTALKNHIPGPTAAGGSEGPLAARLAEALRQPTVDEIITALKASCAPLPPLPAEEAIACAPDAEPMTRRLLAAAGVDFLDPFEFSAYILMTVLSGSLANTLKLMIPRIGSDSDEKVFSILKLSGERIVPAAPVVSPWCAAVLAGLFTPFVRETPAAGFERLTTIRDPLDPAISARAFTFRDSAREAETVTVIQANIDDMTPEILAQAVRVILGRGALDVTVVPALMKKGRPGFLVEVLARPEDRTELEELLLRETSTFGVRSFACSRTVLDRRQEDFDSSFGRIRVKHGYWRGTCLRSVPEYEDVAALSDKNGIPLLRLYTDIQSEIARAGKEKM